MDRRIGQVPPLCTVVVAMSISAPALSQWRAEFPDIRFIVLDEDAGADDRYRIAPTAPRHEDLQGADALIGWDLDAQTLEIATRLRWVHAGSAGVDHFDLKAIAARGITMTNSRGVFAPNIGEHVLGMMLALARRLPSLVHAQAAREWRDQQTHREVAELQGQAVLVVGTGEIGRAVARRASAFGMRVQGLRRRMEAEPLTEFDRVFGMSMFPTALARADHVVITLPDTPHTRGLFDARAFAAMKPGAILYNVGRGPVVDTTAMIDALGSGRLGGAGLDVTDPEPLPAESPLWSMENVLITSHTSGATPRYWDRQGRLIAENIRRIQRGDSPRNIVDLDAGY